MVNKSLNDFQCQILLGAGIFVEVSPFFHGTKIPSILFCLLLSFLFIRFKFKIDIRIIYWIIFVFLLSFLQNLFGFGRGIVPTIASTFWSIVTPYFLFRIIGDDVFYRILRFVRVTSQYTFIIWILFTLIPFVKSFLMNLAELSFNNFNFGDTIPRALLFFTVPFHELGNGSGLMRNNGIFHEPGAFGFWLVLSLLIGISYREKIFSKNNLFILLSIFSTFSTTSYLSFSLIILLLIFKSNTSFYLKLLSFFLIIPIFYFSYNNLSFLGEKISSNYEKEAKIDLENLSSNDRIARFRKTINAIIVSPILGQYKDYEKNKSLDIIEKRIQNDSIGNASLGIIATKGIIGGFLFYIFYLRGINKLVSRNNFSKKSLIVFFIFIIIILNGFSQRFLDDSITNLFVVYGLLKNTIK